MCFRFFNVQFRDKDSTFMVMTMSQAWQTTHFCLNLWSNSGSYYFFTKNGCVKTTSRMSNQCSCHLTTSFSAPLTSNPTFPPSMAVSPFSTWSKLGIKRSRDLYINDRLNLVFPGITLLGSYRSRVGQHRSSIRRSFWWYTVWHFFLPPFLLWK